MTRTLWALWALTACEPRFADTADPYQPDSGTTAATSTSVSTSTSTSTSVCAQQGFGNLTSLWATDLRDAMTTAVQSQTCYDYAAATFHMFVRLDKVEDAVTCVYTGRSTPVYFDKPDAEDMNTEHSWPQSDGADTLPAKCDLHHLFPTDSHANAQRASHPFGEVTTAVSWEEGGSQLGQDVTGTTVFEPRDDHKGNVARAMLYFSIRYSYSLSNEQVALFKAWHLSDPVDQAEMDRSLGIAEYQELANPLVVCPELVQQL